MLPLLSNRFVSASPISSEREQECRPGAAGTAEEPPLSRMHPDVRSLPPAACWDAHPEPLTPCKRWAAVLEVGPPASPPGQFTSGGSGNTDLKRNAETRDLPNSKIHYNFQSFRSKSFNPSLKLPAHEPIRAIRFPQTRERGSGRKELMGAVRHVRRATVSRCPLDQQRRVVGRALAVGSYSSYSSGRKVCRAKA